MRLFLCDVLASTSGFLDSAEVFFDSLDVLEVFSLLEDLPIVRIELPLDVLAKDIGSEADNEHEEEHHVEVGVGEDVEELEVLQRE